MDERRRQSVDSKAADFTPFTFILWENALEKLKVLDYEQHFCKLKNISPFTRTYFAVQAENPSLQFQSFNEIVSWLFGLIAGSAPNPYVADKYDDPNSCVNKIMLALKSASFDMDFPAIRLKQGYGHAVCSAIDFLAEKSLLASNFVFRYPTHDEEVEEEAELDEEADIGQQDEDDSTDIEEHVAELADVGDDHLVHGEQLVMETNSPTSKRDSAQFVETTVNPIEWKTELERVAPKLKIALQSHGAQWRSHIDSTKNHIGNINQVASTSQSQLSSIATEVEDSLERTKSKERHTNSQFGSQSSICSKLRGECRAIETERELAKSRVVDMNDKLSAIMDEADELKGKMNMKGDQMSEASPLVCMKQSLRDIKTEIRTFDLRIGVVSHSLLSIKFQHGKKVLTKPSCILPPIMKHRIGHDEQQAGEDDMSTTSINY